MPRALKKEAKKKRNKVDPDDFWRNLNIDYYETFPELAEDHGWDREKMRYKRTNAKSTE